MIFLNSFEQLNILNKICKNKNSFVGFLTLEKKNVQGMNIFGFIFIHVANLN